jgi:hypothetical protein
MYSDDFVDNDLDILENESTIRPAAPSLAGMQPEEETKESEAPTEELNNVNLNSDDEAITIPKD